MFVEAEVAFVTHSNTKNTTQHNNKTEMEKLNRNSTKMNESFTQLADQ